MSDSKFDVIVVGAGISGLLSALALSKEGKRVLVLEKSGAVGGNCRTYEVEDTGFFVDTGAHSITALRDGPLVQLMDRYFSQVPKFVPHGNYYVRDGNELKKAPNTIHDVVMFDTIPRKDRLILAKLTIEALANHALSKGTEISVYDYISRHNLSEKTLKFLDTMAYFLAGVSMKDMPLWRMISGTGLADEGERRLKKKIYDLKRIALNSTYSEHGYPRGGIGTITKCILGSLPKSAKVHTGEPVQRIENKGGIFCLSTPKGKYSSGTVVYSGEAKKLPRIAEMPDDWSQSAKKLVQSKAITIWLGLKKKIKALDYCGSEVWFRDGAPYWAVPTSNYDPHLAPRGKQLVGFSAFLHEKEGPRKYEKKLLRTIYSAVPEIEENVEMKHTQVMVPEKAAISIGVKFPSVQTPIRNLYLVGTDADMRSMGITRAAYSVVEMLKAMGIW